MATAEEIFARLQALVGDAVSEPVAPPPPGQKDAVGPRDAGCRVVPAKWLDVARTLRDDEALRFDFCQCLTAVDWPKQSKLEMVYHLYSYALHHAFVVRADLPRENPVIPSVASIWPTAEWHEREQFDLLGVGFVGHPDLRRIMMPDDWVGHPMRKDWKEPARYHGMPTTRPSPLELLPMFDKAPPEQKMRLPVVGNGPAAAAAAGGHDEGHH